MTWLAVPLAGLTVVSTLLGGLLALRLARDLTTAIALSGGVVVAVALFHVLPEAVDAVDDPAAVGSLIGAGFLAFFLAERLLVLHHRDDAAEARAHAQVGVLGAELAGPAERRVGERGERQRSEPGVHAVEQHGPVGQPGQVVAERVVLRHAPSIAASSE